jgi:DNA-binding SARP family transcriptional activator/ATP/maltotriose-dependent transcriptional regulator MalT
VDDLRRAQVGSIVAGGGYGKTTLAIEVALALGDAWALARFEPGDDGPEAPVLRLRSAFARTGLSDAADALDPGAVAGDGVDRLLEVLAACPEPLLVVLDEISNAGSEALQQVARLSRELPQGVRLLLVGRTMPATLARAPATVRIGQPELAFTEGETAAVLSGAVAALDSDAARRLHRATGGWPIAVQLAAVRLGRSDDALAELDRIESTAALLTSLVEQPLRSLPSAEREAVVQVAHLPVVTVGLAERATGVPGVVDLARAAGVPLDVDGSGTVELPDPVREVLTARSDLHADVAARAAAAYLESGRGADAIRLLVSAGRSDEAAETAAALPAREISRLDIRELRALLSAIPHASLDRHPRALMHLARACEASAERELRSGLLARAEAAAPDDPALQREVVAERSRDLVRDGNVDEARALAEQLLRDAGPDELQTRVRALHVLGRTHAWSGTPEGLAAAEPLLEEAAELYGRLGFHTARAHALLALAYDVHTLGGRFEAAVETLERALAGLPARSRLRGVVLVFLAEALIDLGRSHEAEAGLVEAERLGTLFADTRTLGYAAWLRARAAASLGDAERVREQLAEAERHHGEWFVHHTGAEFLAEASLLLGQVGDRDGAEAYLRRALERVDEGPRHVRLAEGALEARHGDPERAEQLLAELAARPDLDVREAWRPALLRSWARSRAGDTDAAAALARETFALAARTGAPDLPARREPELAEALAVLVDASDGGDAHATAAASITVLGGFSARRAGAVLELPPGRPTALVQLLAVHGGRRHADAAIEALWPGVEASSGRKRLRNVLNRLRESAGELVARDGQTLAFVEGTDVDAVLFEQRASEALAHPDDPMSLDRARAALALYSGEALPDERYEDWAAEPRERLRSRALGLLDLLAAAAERHGDVDEALRLLERAIEIDRLDESRYVRAARLLLRQGRRGRALDMLRAGAGAVRELGLEPSAEHRTLVRSARA